MTLPNGIHYDVPREDYDRIDRMNWSRLKVLGRSPAHFRHALLNGREDTNALKLGRVRHIAIYEPERYAASVVVWKDGIRRGKAWDAFRRKHADREIITEAEDAAIKAFQVAVRGDETAARYLSGGRAEVTVLWTDRATGIDLKARLDFVSSAGAIIDLKSTRLASPDGFAKEAWRYSYHVQAAIYSEGYEAASGGVLPFKFVAAESDAPHVTQVYGVPEAVLDVGREEFHALLEHYAFCRRESKWSGYFDGEAELELPRWAVSFSDEEGIDGLDLVINGADGAEAANDG